jgi:hypothetical protein
MVSICIGSHCVLEVRELYTEIAGPNLRRQIILSCKQNGVLSAVTGRNMFQVGTTGVAVRRCA